MSNHPIKYHKDLISSFLIILLTDKQTGENITSLFDGGKKNYTKETSSETSLSCQADKNGNNNISRQRRCFCLCLSVRQTVVKV